MKHTISALVENRPGVLADMAQAFSKDAVNITSISCGETEKPHVSRMVIRVDAKDEQDEQVRRITETVASMDFVIKVDDLSRKEFVDRELVLVKVAMDNESATRIMQVFEVFRANVVGMGRETITVEMTGDEERVEGLIKMLEPYGIKSMCRTGLIALKRGDE